MNMIPSSQYRILTRFTVSNKNAHLPVFEICVFSPEPLELQKVFCHLFASLSKELSDEKNNFEVRSQNQLIFAKTVF